MKSHCQQILPVVSVYKYLQNDLADSLKLSRSLETVIIGIFYVPGYDDDMKYSSL